MAAIHCLNSAVLSPIDRESGGGCGFLIRMNDRCSAVSPNTGTLRSPTNAALGRGRTVGLYSGIWLGAETLVRRGGLRRSFEMGVFWLDGIMARERSAVLLRLFK